MDAGTRRRGEKTKVVSSKQEAVWGAHLRTQSSTLFRISNL
jgi:hypothetical protein